MNYEKPREEIRAREERFRRHEERLIQGNKGKEQEIKMIMDTAYMISAEITGIDFIAASIRELTDSNAETKKQITWWLGTTVLLITIITTVSKFL